MALIRCKKCGNPVSSRSKACPVCGEPIAAETIAPQTIADTAPKAKTLNDIIAERGSAPRTLHDTLSSEPKTSNEPTPTPTTTATPAEPAPAHEEAREERHEEARTAGRSEGATSQPSESARDYEREIEDYEDELWRRDRSIKGFRWALIIAIIVLIPSLCFCIMWGLKAKAIEEDYAIVESARKLFEEQNTMLQHDAESLVSELEELKDKNDTMMIKYQEAVVMLEQLQKEKTYNYEQLARYKKEVNTLRGVMKGYLRQIDSLNTINK